VDESKPACLTIQQNLTKTRLSAKGNIKTMKVDLFLRHLGTTLTFDLIFADPPYAKDQLLFNELTTLLNHEKLPAALKKGGFLILETSSRKSLPESPLWTVDRDKTYGETRITFLTPKPSDV